MTIKIISHGSDHYQKMVDLRYEILRKPLKLRFSPVDLAQEKHDILIGAFKEEHLLACCILTKLEEGHIKLRQMAVDKSNQGIGIGTQVLSFAEKFACDNGYRTLIMHARETAIGFYEKLGYQIQGECFKEVGLKHFKMQKRLIVPSA